MFIPPLKRVKWWNHNSLILTHIFGDKSLERSAYQKNNDVQKRFLINDISHERISKLKFPHSKEEKLCLSTIKTKRIFIIGFVGVIIANISLYPFKIYWDFPVLFGHYVYHVLENHSKNVLGTRIFIYFMVRCPNFIVMVIWSSLIQWNSIKMKN